MCDLHAFCPGAHHGCAVPLLYAEWGLPFGPTFTHPFMLESHRADRSLVTSTLTFLFTDIEGSTRLWEVEPERMQPALARHDAISRAAVTSHRGLVVKSTGDGMHAVFGDALDALAATVDLQQAFADPAATNGVPLRVRCG